MAFFVFRETTHQYRIKTVVNSRSLKNAPLINFHIILIIYRVPANANAWSARRPAAC